MADRLGVKLEVVSLQKEYWNEVVSYTLEEARSGRTPNPDVMCNSRIKFGMFYEYVGKYFDKIATGHYARTIQDSNGLSRLLISNDTIKDQVRLLLLLLLFDVIRCDVI